MVFTGIVRATGRVVSAEKTPAGVRFAVRCEDWPGRGAPGDSVCVAGVCLTVVGDAGSGGSVRAFDLIPETLACTTLGSRRPGDPVNIEPSLELGDPIDGHLVQGHVEGVGEVKRVEQGEGYRVRIRPPAALLASLAPKGSVCVDGVSLTIAAVGGTGGVGGAQRLEWFEVALIPETLSRTTLGGLRAGDRVNLETDMMARSVVHVLRVFGVLPPGV